MVALLARDEQKRVALLVLRVERELGVERVLEPLDAAVARLREDGVDVGDRGAVALAWCAERFDLA